MKFSSQPAAAVLLALVTITSASALELRSYDSALHDRFANFPDDPSFNSGFFYDPRKLTGIGWDAGGSGRQYALVSRCHILFARHHAPAIGSRIRFLSSTGSIIERSVSESTVVPNPSGSTSDLALLTLSSPIEADEGISPLPYLNLPDEESYLDRELIVFGSSAKAGEGKLGNFRTINVNWFISRVFNFDYDLDADGSNDARLASGDSGSPSLVDIDGSPALIGVHLASSNGDEVQSNFDAFIPHYIGQINPLMADSGFRMRPLNSEATRLDCRLSKPSSTARRGRPLEVDLEIANQGESTTGNLEVTISFPPGTSPDSLTGDGWVVTGEGDEWMARRATLDSSAESSLRATWSETPEQTRMEPVVRWSSDSAPEGSSAFSISLDPYYSAWANGLDEFGLSDDPDSDGLDNLLEYALGSDPATGVSGGVPGPRLSTSGDRVVFRFPEREDKDSRGLSYTPQWSGNLAAGSWSSSAPPGWSSSTSPFSPAVPGFVERIVSWPMDEDSRFVRLHVSLTE